MSTSEWDSLWAEIESTNTTHICMKPATLDTSALLMSQSLLDYEVCLLQSLDPEKAREQALRH